MYKSNVQIFQGAYDDALQKNAESIRLHKERKEKLGKLNLQYYSEFLALPILVPIGTKVFMRGNLMHTTNFLVALSDQYFTKCSLKQAEEIRQHRIQGAENNLKELEKEKDFLSNHAKFTNDSVFDTNGREIIEPYDEEEELKWRDAHKYNLKKEKTSKTERNVESFSDLMARLDELEIQEEIETMKEYDTFNNIAAGENDSKMNNSIEIMENNIENKFEIAQNAEKYINVNAVSNSYSGRTIEKTRRKDIHEKLKSIRLKLNEECKTEEVMFKRLDALEEEEMLLDELDRLSENSSEINSEEATEDEEYRIQEMNSKTPRRISFDWQIEEANTLTINFSHTDNFGEKGDSKSTGDHNSHSMLESPKDMYSCFPECFSDDLKPLKSILKQELTEGLTSVITNPIEIDNNEELQFEIKDTASLKAVPVNKEIVIGDIIENNRPQLEKPTNRPISKFKATRLKAKKPIK